MLDELNFDLNVFHLWNRSPCECLAYSFHFWIIRGQIKIKLNPSFVKLLIVLMTVNWYYMFWQRRWTANNLVVHINVVLVIIKLYLEHFPLSLVGRPHSLFPQHVIQQLKINFFVQFCKIVHVYSSLNRSVFYDFWCLRPCGALTHFAISLRMLRFLQVFKFESFNEMHRTSSKHF